jgi:hypothetical protein
MAAKKETKPRLYARGLSFIGRGIRVSMPLASAGEPRGIQVVLRASETDFC